LLGGTKAHYTAGIGAGLGALIEGSRAALKERKKGQKKEAFSLASVGLKGGGTVAGGLLARRKAKGLGQVPDAPEGASKKERLVAKLRQGASAHPNLAALGGAAGGYTAGAGAMNTLNYLAGE
jgi:hypothetical protein